MISAERIDKFAKSAKESVRRLKGEISLGSGRAAVELYRVAAFATEALERMCLSEPTVFRAIAEKKFSWPVVCSRHSESRERTNRLLNMLNLGGKTGLNFSSAGKGFSYTRPANRIAIYLHALACALQRAPIAEWNGEEYMLLTNVARFSRSPSSPNAFVVAKDDDQEQALENWGQQGVGSRLPPLSRKTAKDWRAALPALFRLVYGNNFDENPLLQELKNDVARSAKTAEGKPGQAGHVRAEILKRVKQAFGSIAALD
jgi:hypothetical protein